MFCIPASKLLLYPMKQFLPQLWDSDLRNQWLLGFYMENPLVLLFTKVHLGWNSFILFSKRMDLLLLRKVGLPITEGAVMMTRSRLNKRQSSLSKTPSLDCVMHVANSSAQITPVSMKSTWRGMVVLKVINHCMYKHVPLQMQQGWTWCLVSHQAMSRCRPPICSASTRGSMDTWLSLGKLNNDVPSFRKGCVGKGESIQLWHRLSQF